jgi:hypothetical protein
LFLAFKNRTKKCPKSRCYDIGGLDIGGPDIGGFFKKDIGGLATLEVYKITYNLAEYKEYLRNLQIPFPPQWSVL